MCRFLFSLIVICSTLCKCETNKQQVDFDGIVNAKAGLFLREGPSRRFGKVKLIPHLHAITARVELTKSEIIGGRSGKWTQVKYRGTVGWVFGGFLTKIETYLKKTTSPVNSIHTQFLNKLERLSSRLRFHSKARAYIGEGGDGCHQHTQLHFRKGAVVFDDGIAYFSFGGPVEDIVESNDIYTVKFRDVVSHDAHVQRKEFTGNSMKVHILNDRIKVISRYVKGQFLPGPTGPCEIRH